MRIFCAFIIYFCLTIHVSAHDLDAGRQMGMGGAVMLTSPSATDVLITPVALISDRQLLLESGFQNRYDLPELDKGYVAMGYRMGAFSVGLGYSQFGKATYYSEKIARASFGFYYGVFAIGINGSGKEIEIGEGYGKYRANSLGFSAGLHYDDYHLAVVGDNLNKPSLADEAAVEPALWNVFAEVKGSKAFSICGRISFKTNNKPSAAISQYIYLKGKNAIFWGVSGNPLKYGGGMEISYRGFILGYAAEYHPVLGLIHNISIGMAWKH